VQLLVNMVYVASAVFALSSSLAVLLLWPLRCCTCCGRKKGFGFAAAVRRLVARLDLRPEIVLLAPLTGQSLRRAKTAIGGFVSVLLGSAVVTGAVAIALTFNDAANVHTTDFQVGYTFGTPPLVTASVLLRDTNCSDLALPTAHPLMLCAAGSPERPVCQISMQAAVHTAAATIEMTVARRDGRPPGPALLFISSVGTPQSVRVPLSLSVSVTLVGFLCVQIGPDGRVAGGWPVECATDLAQATDAWLHLPSVPRFLLSSSRFVCEDTWCAMPSLGATGSQYAGLICATDPMG
jgi:hypothetical protein